MSVPWRHKGNDHGLIEFFKDHKYTIFHSASKEVSAKKSELVPNIVPEEALSYGFFYRNSNYQMCFGSTEIKDSDGNSLVIRLGKDLHCQPNKLKTLQSYHVQNHRLLQIYHHTLTLRHLADLLGSTHLNRGVARNYEPRGHW